MNVTNENVNLNSLDYYDLLTHTLYLVGRQIANHITVTDAAAIVSYHNMISIDNRRWKYIIRAQYTYTHILDNYYCGDPSSIWRVHVITIIMSQIDGHYIRT
jgi:hypothetical protein